MYKVLISIAALVSIASLNPALAAEEMMRHGNHHHEMSAMDTRISLELSPEMKQHQLANMRGHVEAIKSIVGLMAEKKFAEASSVAHSQLGLTPEMQSMCDMFSNENFRKQGYAFHKSGDELGDVLKTKNVNKSLHALNKTMGYCVECHATFRQ